MGNINTGVQARKMASTVNYWITSSQNILIVPYHNPQAFWTEQEAFCLDSNRGQFFLFPFFLFLAQTDAD